MRAVAAPHLFLVVLVLGAGVAACAARDDGRTAEDEDVDGAASTGAGGQMDAGNRDAGAIHADAATSDAREDAGSDAAAGDVMAAPGPDAGHGADSVAPSPDIADASAPVTCGQGTGFDTSAPGVALDRATCLAWQRLDPAKPSGTCQLTTDSPAKLCWAEATKYCHGLRLAGRDDWRLPTAAELHTIVVPAAYPADDAQLFPETLLSLYWTADTLGEKVVCVDFSNGGMRNDHIGPDGAQGVRCVRGPLPR
jgi:hypothetical protein